jgi:hypothetical protein
MAPLPLPEKDITLLQQYNEEANQVIDITLLPGVPGQRGPNGLPGVIAQPTAPSDTKVLWIDTDDIGAEISSSPASIIISDIAPSHAQLWADTSTTSAQVAVFDGGTPSGQINSIKTRRGNASVWISIDPILDSGEFGFELDTRKFKIGNGSTRWNSLGYAVAPAELIDPIMTGTITMTNTAIIMTGATISGGTITGGSA